MYKAQSNTRAQIAASHVIVVDHLEKPSEN
jgi:hypothetical protein